MQAQSDSILFQRTIKLWFHYIPATGLQQKVQPKRHASLYIRTCYKQTWKQCWFTRTHTKCSACSRQRQKLQHQNIYHDDQWDGTLANPHAVIAVASYIYLPITHPDVRTEEYLTTLTYLLLASQRRRNHNKIHKCKHTLVFKETVIGQINRRKLENMYTESEPDSMSRFLNKLEKSETFKKGRSNNFRTSSSPKSLKNSAFALRHTFRHICFAK